MVIVFVLSCSSFCVCWTYCSSYRACCCVVFFFNDPATTEIYTLSLHDALPILPERRLLPRACTTAAGRIPAAADRDRKSTRLNSSHLGISYAVFCLKKKKKKKKHTTHTRNRTQHT